MTMHAMWNTRMLRAALLVAAAIAAGCTTNKTEAPELSGPSEFGQSISVAATPDRLSQDGVSQARVEATIRDSQGKPTQGVTVQWTINASTGVLVEPSLQQTMTDAQGRAAILVTAPQPPAFVPDAPARLTITAKAVGTDMASTLNTKSVVVQLVPPPGTLLPNRPPEASFSIVPAIGNIMQELVFDASGTKDEGEPCGDLCTYQWDFGDVETASGRVVRHSYLNPRSSPGYTVTLTVVDARGGVDSITRGVIINGPAAPTVTFTSTATDLKVTFNATITPAGAVIEEYNWDFGDPPGTITTTTAPATSHTYPAGAPGTTTSYPVILTVKDNYGRTATFSSTVSVKTP